MNQGRAADVLPFTEGGEASPVAPAGWLAFRALAQALTGDTDGARHSLDRIFDEQLLDAESAFILTSASVAAWAARVSGDRHHTAALRGLLSPFGGLVATGGMLDIAAVDSLLGMLASLDGRHDDADELFASGLELEERYEAPVLAARSRYWWAHSLLDRDGPGDRDRAIDLLRDCLGSAERLGMTQLAADALALLDAKAADRS